MLFPYRKSIIFFSKPVDILTIFLRYHSYMIGEIDEKQEFNHNLNNVNNNLYDNGRFSCVL